LQAFSTNSLISKKKEYEEKSTVLLFLDCN